MRARIEYAKLITEKGASYIKEGFITATPYEDKDGNKSTCDYCQFGAVCGYEKNLSKGTREHIKADAKTIIWAIKNKDGGDVDAT